LANAPSVANVGAEFALLFSHVSPPLPPDVLGAVAPAPPLPMFIKTVAPEAIPIAETSE
jgi:hypothetical protein